MANLLCEPFWDVFELGLALRGQKNSYFSVLGLKSPFFDFGLALRGKNISDCSTLGPTSPFFDLGLALRGRLLGVVKRNRGQTKTAEKRFSRANKNGKNTVKNKTVKKR